MHTFKTAGYSAEDLLQFDPGPTQCGSIEDGVAFEHDKKGAWVVAYNDLIEVALLAVTARKGPKP